MHPPEQGPLPLRLYGREGCHLCEEALALIEELRPLVPPFALELVDIESDAALHRDYLERIPVAERGGEILFELVPDRRALLEALGARGTF